MNEKNIFGAALDIIDPIERQAFIEKACLNNQDLLLKVRSLLAAYEQSKSFLEHPAFNVPSQAFLGSASSQAADNTNDFFMNSADDEIAARETKLDAKSNWSFLAPSAKPGSIGLLGHYEILEVLGQGGFGIVFKAFDEKLHRIVAIKVMNPELAATSPPRKRFLREARSVAAIKNENIVQVYSVEETPLPYMVMEFVDGSTLQGKLDGNGPLSPNEVLHLGRQMASALAAAHALNIIHRDIKPGNILLEKGVGQKIKITDFGLARTADDASMTHTGVISGTPLYMSPEQALGQQLDHRSDLFSLGSVLYQMLSGRAPFRAPTAIAVLRRVADDTPRPLQEIIPEIPDWLAALVTKLHAKKPSERFQSAQEVADLMARYQSEIQLHGQVKSFHEIVPPFIPSDDTVSRTAKIVRSHYTRKELNKRLLSIAATIVLSTLPIAMMIHYFRSPDVEIVSDTKTPFENSDLNSRLAISDPDRSIAEWVLAQPAPRSIAIEGTQERLTSLDQLPSTPFKLTEVYFDALTEGSFSDADLERLGSVAHLKTLSLIGAKRGMTFNGISEEGFKKFAAAPAAKSLSTLYFYLDQCPRVTDESITYINELQQLTNLTLCGTSFSPMGLQQLNLPALYVLQIDQRKPVSPQSFVGIELKSPLLSIITLDGCFFGEASLEGISRLSNLQQLDLSHTGASDESVIPITKVNTLENIHLKGNSKIGDSTVERLSNLPNIEHIRLDYTNITDASCQYLKKMQKLRFIALVNTQISDEGLESLASLSSLQSLVITNCPRITEPAVRKLQAALPNCQIDSDFSDTGKK